MRLAHHFEEIYDVYFCGNQGKPALSAYQRLLDALGVEAGSCLLVEDSIANLRPAQALGMTTVLVDPPLGEELSGADYVISRVAQVAEIVCQVQAQA
jgi:putative hydrolase of the HAD superfamily